MKHLRVSFSFPRPNYFSAPHVAPATTVKVVLSDGVVQEFHDDTLTVAELMLEHPQEVVVEFDSEMVTGRSRRPVALPADTKLEADKVYMMFPLKRGKLTTSLLASDEARRRNVVLSTANALLKQSSSSSSSFSYKFMPLFARACTIASFPARHEGNVDIKLVTLKKEKNCDDEEVKITKLTDGRQFFEEDKDDDDEEGMWSENKVPEYLSRQLSGKGWKPTLDTIKEKKIEQQKLPHWLF